MSAPIVTDTERNRIADIVSRALYKLLAEQRDPDDVLLAIAHAFDGDRIAIRYDATMKERSEEYQEVARFISARIWGDCDAD